MCMSWLRGHARQALCPVMGALSQIVLGAATGELFAGRDSATARFGPCDALPDLDVLIGFALETLEPLTNLAKLPSCPSNRGLPNVLKAKSLGQSPSMAPPTSPVRRHRKHRPDFLREVRPFFSGTPAGG